MIDLRCVKQQKHERLDRLQSAGSKRHISASSTFILLWKKKNTLQIGKITTLIMICLFQSRLCAVKKQHFGSLRALLPRIGSSAPVSRIQSNPRGSGRASASGASLRRSDVEVQVGELPPRWLNCFLCAPARSDKTEVCRLEGLQ